VLTLEEEYFTVMKFCFLVLLLQGVLCQTVPRNQPADHKHTSSKKENADHIVVYYCQFTANTYAPLTPELLHVPKRSRTIVDKANIDKLLLLLKPDTNVVKEDPKKAKGNQVENEFDFYLTRLIVDRPQQPQLLVDQRGNVKWGQRKFHINPLGVDKFLHDLFAKH